jgi:hypothetical protein
MRGRQQLKPSINPINLIDLQNLKRWRDQNAYIKINDHERVTLHYRRLTLNDIPDTYSFDKYGLIVQGEFVSMSTDERSHERRTKEPGGSPSRRIPITGQSTTRERLKRSNRLASLKTVGRKLSGAETRFNITSGRIEEKNSATNFAQRLAK